MKKNTLILCILSLALYTRLEAFNIRNFFANIWKPKISKELSSQQHFDLQTGNYYFWLKDFTQAEQYYLKLARSGYPYAQRLLSTVYWGQGNYRKATECLLKQAQTAPTAEVYRDLGSIYLRFGQEEQAVEYLKKAAALNYGLALRDLTIIYFNQNLYALAEEYGKRAADVGNLEVCAMLSSFFWNKKAYEKAEYFLLAAAKHDSTPYIHLSYIYNDVYHDEEKALNILKEGLEKENLLCALELGNIYYARKEYALAEHYFKQLTACSLEDPRIQHMVHKNHFKIPLSEFELYKNVAQNMLGHVYESQGLDDQALACFLITAHTNDVQGQYASGALYLRKNNIAEGLRYLQLSADQGYDMALYTLGKYYFENKDLAKAKQYLEQCSKNTHQTLVVNTNLMLGHIYQEEKNIAAALTHYKNAAAHNESTACYEYALLNEDQHNIEEAREYYQKAADLGHQLAHDKLRALQYYPAS